MSPFPVPQDTLQLPIPDTFFHDFCLSPKSETTPVTLPNNSLPGSSTATSIPPPVRHSIGVHKPPAYLQQYQTFQASMSPVTHISNFVYTTTQPEFTSLLSTFNIHKDPLYYKDAFTKPGWVQPMNTVLQALENYNT